MQTITSKDGTLIAYDQSGHGPAVILVAGALVDRSAHHKLAKLLSANFTVYNFDRRGRADSGDTELFTVRKEIEDIEALILVAGGSACLYGISSGACLALEASAALGDKVTKLAIYEAPYDEAPGKAQEWKEYSAELNTLLASDRNSEALKLHLKIVGIPAIVLFIMKLLPMWSKMKTLAHTIAYDVAIVGTTRSIPTDRFSRIKAATLVMDGGGSLKSMPFMSASANTIAQTIPNSKRFTLEGQKHNVDERKLAPVLRDFFQ